MTKTQTLSTAGMTKVDECRQFHILCGDTYRCDKLATQTIVFNGESGPITLRMCDRHADHWQDRHDA